jgi:hypothetical protein
MRGPPGPPGSSAGAGTGPGITGVSDIPDNSGVYPSVPAAILELKPTLSQCQRYYKYTPKSDKLNR